MKWRNNRCSNISPTFNNIKTDYVSQIECVNLRITDTCTKYLIQIPQSSDTSIVSDSTN